MSQDQLARLLSGPDDWPASARDWEQLLSQARGAMLSARLAAAATARAVPVPERVAAHFEAACKVQRHRAQAMHVEVQRVARALAGAGIRCVLLKGAAYLCAGLAPAQARVFGDIDLLLPQADLVRAESALMGAGWISNDLTLYNQRYYREWMHEIPPLIHMTRASVIDLHHTITPPTSAFNVAGRRLLECAVPLDPPANLWVLQPADMVLHSAVHLFTEGEFDHGLRDLLDLDDLLCHFGQVEPGFWPALLARAGELGLQRPLYYALIHIERLLGARVPPVYRGEVDAVRPAWPQRAAMAWLLTIGLRPNHPSCQGVGDDLARWLLYVRSHWLRMPLRLLVPHLVRKAWRTRFPDRPPKPAEAGATRT